MRIAPVPAYTVLDGLNVDLDATMVYERLMGCQDISHCWISYDSSFPCILKPLLRCYCRGIRKNSSDRMN